MRQGGRDRGNRGGVCQGGTKEERKRKIDVRDEAEIRFPKKGKEKKV